MELLTMEPPTNQTVSQLIQNGIKRNFDFLFWFIRDQNIKKLKLLKNSSLDL